MFGEFQGQCGMIEFKFLPGVRKMVWKGAKVEKEMGQTDLDVADSYY